MPIASFPTASPEFSSPDAAAAVSFSLSRLQPPSFSDFVTSFATPDFFAILQPRRCRFSAPPAIFSLLQPAGIR